jgi:tetratricopeptide (TPR) repeat protein
MTLSPGTRLGPYEILAAIGAGGMGEVYQARDTRLGRTVAIKVLPPGASADPARRARFEQEARAVSSLNHPHICVLHDIGREGDTDFLVMEYLDGQTLAQRLHKGSLPLAQAVELGAQVADALATAHRHGIVHRDLKPANVMLTKAGAKLLDFGLAKLKPPPLAAGAGVSELSTQAPATMPGMVMGTVPYMAPEQLEGKETDARTDLFAFGCVLYEMLTAQRAFGGDSEASVISAIMRGEPAPLSSLQPLTPPALDRLVRRCLAKDPDDRWQHAADVAEELRGISADSGAPGPAAAARARFWRWRRILPSATAAVLVIVAAAWLLAPRAPALTSSDTILLADFQNTTGDPVFDLSLQEALTAKLQESPYLRIYSREDVRQALKLMRRPADSPVSGEVARESCVRQGLKAMVSGAISPLGRGYLIEVKAVAAQSGDQLALSQEQATSKEEVIKQLGVAGGGLRRKLGESVASLKQFDAPLPQATTSSLDALKAYAMGLREMNKGKDAEAFPLFRRAIELDPNFALAQRTLAVRLRAISQKPDPEIPALFQKAYDLRAGLTERERLMVTGTYQLNVEGNPAKFDETYELFTRLYPNDAHGYISLCYGYENDGQYEKALKACRDGYRVSSNNAFIYANLVETLRDVNQFDEAQRLTEEALAKQFNPAWFSQYLYDLAFVKGGAAKVEQMADAARGTPAEGDAMGYRARAAAFSGKLRQSGNLFRQAIEFSRRNGNPGAAAYYTGEWANADAQSGNCAQARQRLVSALSWLRDADGLISASFPLARCGETDRAEALAEEWGRANDPRAVEVKTGMTAAKAVVALFKGRPDVTVELLPPSIGSYGLGDLRNWFVRGEAYLALREGGEAAREFQAVLDHRGLGPFDYHWPLAHLGLARAMALTGDTARSRQMYEAFFRLWKDADPGLPVLKAARAEYARLK